jgi:hypothetical protein
MKHTPNGSGKKVAVGRRGINNRPKRVKVKRSSPKEGPQELGLQYYRGGERLKKEHSWSLEGGKQRWTIRRRKKKEKRWRRSSKKRAKRRLECVKLVAGVAGAPALLAGRSRAARTD